MRKMIKLISMVCLVAMLIGMLPVLGVSAAGTATLELVTAFDEVKAGKEFTIDVNIANNPGIQASMFELNYDASKFDYVGSEKGTLFGSTEITVPTGTTNIVRFVLSSGSGTVNVTDNGKIASVTFRTKADVQVDDTYTFTTTVSARDTINTSKEQVALADASKTVTFVDANTSLTSIDGAQVNLGTDISVTYKVTLDPDHAGAQMKFTIHGDEYVVDGVATDAANVYEYTLINVAPQCMGDNIKAEVWLNGAAVKTMEEYSILQNCQNLLDKTAAELEMSDEKYAAMKTLIDNLLVYGATAQVYQSYKTNNLVTAIPALDSIPSEENVRELGGGENASVGELISVGVRFDYVNSFFFKFKYYGSKPLTTSNVKVAFEDADGNAIDGITVDDVKKVESEENTYIAYTSGISVLDYGTPYVMYFKLPKNVGTANIYTILYSVNSYAYVMQSSSNPAMQNLAKALYQYGVSASAFQTAE